MDKKSIISVRLIGTTKRTSNSYGKNLPYRSYRVLVDTEGRTGELIPLQALATKEELKTLPYWSTRSDRMAMTCWGTSQLFEAQIAIARWLGLDDKGRWADFSREATQLVQEL